MASYSKKSLVYVIIRNILFVLVFVALYQYVYKNFEAQLKGQTSLKERYQGVYNDLAQFVKMNENMYETKIHIEDVILSMPLDFVPNPDLLTGYRDRVMAVADKYSIKNTTETVVKDETTGMVTLTLNFNSKYEALYKFLFDIEMFSRVISFSVDPDNNVEVTSNPILYSVAVDDYFGGRLEKMEEVRAAGYFKEIFKKSADFVNNIGHIPTWRDIDPAPKDPFYEYIPPKPKAGVTKKTVVRRKPPPIEISGIIFDASNPIVIIEGKIYKVGDFYRKDGITVNIVAIQERTITVGLDGQKYIIKFNKEE
jgi:Tfp pilus assembly protein PilO